jgi:hypothetical protein
MSWKECSVMDERLQFVARRIAGEPTTELSQPTQKGQRHPYPARLGSEPHSGGFSIAIGVRSPWPSSCTRCAQ